MKKNNRTLTLITSAVSALSVMAAAAPAQSFAEAEGPYDIDRDLVNVHDIDLSDMTYDFGGKDDYEKDGKANYYDFLIIEKEINRIYAKDGFPNKKYSCSEVELSEEAQKANLTPELFDLTNDMCISPEDYFVYLKAVSAAYRSVFINGEAAFAIIGCALEDETEIVVPSSLYDGLHSCILPVQEIAPEAFSFCEKVEKVYLNDYRQPEWINNYGFLLNEGGEVKASTYLRIKNNAFKGCRNLADIYFPQNIVMESGALNDTAFNWNTYNHFDEGGVDYYRDSNTSSPAILAYRLIDPDSYSDTDLTFMDGTTSINDEIAYKPPFGESIENVNIPASVKYIGFNAFKNCRKLEKVNGHEYSGLGTNVQKKIKRFINAFDGTPFITKETQRIVNHIASNLEKSFTPETTESEKVKAVIKEVVSNITYTSYISPEEISIYPSTLYNSFDYSRLNYGSINAGLNTNFTECGGISMTTSLILDTLGIKNHLAGAENHAYNLVWMKNESTGKYEWHEVDVTTFTGNYLTKSAANAGKNYKEIRRDAANALGDSNLWDIVYEKDSNLHGEDAFIGFTNSELKQFTESGHTFFYVVNNNDRSTVNVYKYNSTENADEIESALNILNDSTFVVSTK